MYIIAAILAFGVLVLVHEFGHFTLAKLNGVTVEEFSIGMGPKLFSIKGKETEYLIKLLPIGGYVKMLGDEGKSNDERAFNNKSPLRKLSIVAAGPFMNFILSIVFFAIIASCRGYLVPVISEVGKNQPAEVVGLKAGDTIKEVNGKKISTWEDFFTAVHNAKGSKMNIAYERNKILDKVEVTPIKDKNENRYIVGVSPTAVTNPTLSQSIKYGFVETKSLITQTISFFGNLFKGRVSKNEVGGPITILKVSTHAAQAGFLSLMTFSAFISAQLGIFNIIPFPALDGGYIFLFLIELITGKSINEEKLGFINYVGFAVLMGLMVLVTIKDIIYPMRF